MLAVDTVEASGLGHVFYSAWRRHPLELLDVVVVEGAGTDQISAGPCANVVSLHQGDDPVARAVVVYGDVVFIGAGFAIFDCVV